MTGYERAQRIAAWTWAAQTLGVGLTAERIEGLVEVTCRVQAENLRPALEQVIQSEPAGYLPSPGAVIAAANRLADRKRSARQLETGRELGPEEHARLMAKLDPQGWTDQQWGAFVARLSVDTAYRDRVELLRDVRSAWVTEQVAGEIGQRHVRAGVVRRIREDYTAEAFERFPRPDPLADGWKPERAVGLDEAFRMPSRGRARGRERDRRVQRYASHGRIPEGAA